jgi:hypothetical protein
MFQDQSCEVAGVDPTKRSWRAVWMRRLASSTKPDVLYKPAVSVAVSRKRRMASGESRNHQKGRPAGRRGRAGDRGQSRPYTVFCSIENAGVQLAGRVDVHWCGVGRNCTGANDRENEPRLLKMPHRRCDGCSGHDSARDHAFAVDHPQGVAATHNLLRRSAALTPCHRHSFHSRLIRLKHRTSCADAPRPMLRHRA